MFVHNKRLQCTVRVSETNPGNTDTWNYVSDRDEQAAVDGGDGRASVKLTKGEIAMAEKLARRTQSDPTSNPVTGADIGRGVTGTSKAPSTSKH